CTHNELEKSRRAHLRACMETLKEHLNFDNDMPRITMLAVLKKATTTIQYLRQRKQCLETCEDNEKQRYAQLVKRRIALRKKLEEKKSRFLKLQNWRERNRNCSECSITTTSSDDSELDLQLRSAHTASHGPSSPNRHPFDPFSRATNLNPATEGRPLTGYLESRRPSEVYDCMCFPKYYRAPDPDDIPLSLLKDMIEVLRQRLSDLVVNIWANLLKGRENHHPHYRLYELRTCRTVEGVGMPFEDYLVVRLVDVASKVPCFIILRMLIRYNRVIGSLPNAPLSDVNSYWDEIAASLHSAGNFACGTAPPGALKHWTSGRTVALLKSRRNIPARPEHNLMRRIIRRQVKVSVQADREVWWTQNAKKIGGSVEYKGYTLPFDREPNIFWTPQFMEFGKHTTRFTYSEGSFIRSKKTGYDTSRIVSGVYTNCKSGSMTLHFADVKCKPKDFDQFIQNHLRLRLFEGEKDVVCIFRILSLVRKSVYTENFFSSSDSDSLSDISIIIVIDTVQYLFGCTNLIVSGILQLRFNNAIRFHRCCRWRTPDIHSYQHRWTLLPSRMMMVERDDSVVGARIYLPEGRNRDDREPNSGFPGRFAQQYHTSLFESLEHVMYCDERVIDRERMLRLNASKYDSAAQREYLLLYMNQPHLLVSTGQYRPSRGRFNLKESKNNPHDVSVDDAGVAKCSRTFYLLINFTLESTNARSILKEA
ncbi:max dimerization protein 3, partial [Clonorchis sinensis]